MTTPYDSERRFPWPVEASLLFCVVIWGTNFVVLKAVMPYMNAMALNLMRILASFIAVFALHLWHTRTHGQTLFQSFREDPWRILATGLLGYTVYQVAFILGLDRTLAGSAALIMASSPIWTASLAALLGIEKLRGLGWVGLIISLFGVGFIIISGQEVDLSTDLLTGNLIMLLAAMCWAAYTTVNRPLLRNTAAVSLTFYGLLVSILPLTAISWPFLGDVVWSDVTLLVWVAIAFSGAFSTGVTVVLWNDAVRQIGPSRTAIYSNLVPVVALITAVSFLGEPLTIGQVVGGAMVIGGLLTVRRSR
ncbi:MAG: EamA family transporter [Rhodothermales bacterium]|nr:EamA family transporter [Rhodothermales bacterium]MBO6781451.1 EamA family transporter [Rhodothermales bacterium]